VIEERAQVTAIDGGFAQVETQRTSACGKCSAQSACGTSALSKLLGSKRTSVRVLNPIDARPGDQVIIGLEESALTRSSFAFYIVPLLSLIGFAITGQRLFEYFDFNNTEPAAIFGGLLGLLAGLAWVRQYASKIQHDTRHQAVILRLQPGTTTGVIHERFVV